MKKRIISILLAIALLCALLPAAVLTASAETYSGTCGANGSNVYWSLNTSSGHLSITGSGDMKNWNYNSSPPWSSYKKSIKSISISNGVTNVGSWAFFNCINLTSVSIGNSVKSIETRAFDWCFDLADITLPNSLLSIGNLAFQDCHDLKSIVIPKSVTSISDYAFYCCIGLEKIAFLSKSCSIGGGHAIPGSTVLYGYANSTAQKYSGTYGNKFVLLLWSSPTYTWSSDYSTVTARCNASNYSGLSESETVNTTSYYSTVPTCLGSGVRTYIARFTSAAFSTQTKSVTVPALGHNYSAWKYTVEPSCTEPGEEEGTCSRCGDTITRAADALGHDYKATVAAPTCTEDGFTTFTCSRCGDKYVSDPTEALGHDYQSVVTPPTCVDKGFTTHTCSRCKDSYVDEETEALGHNYIEVETPPGCTTEGYTLHYCSRCYISYTDSYVDPVGHDFREWVQTTAPTCTEKGVETRTCYSCKATETREIDALGHTPGEAIEENRVEPTCTTYGGFDTVTYCTVCGEELTRFYTQFSPLSHDWDDGVIDPAPTCATDGWWIFTCRRCGETYTDTIAAIGHTAGEAVEQNRVEPTCTDTGSYEAVIYCTVCNVELSREYCCIDALGHTPCEPIKENESKPTCTESGGFDTVVYCAVCNVELSREYCCIDALGHTPCEPIKENESKPTCTESGGFDTVVYCAVCSEELSRTHSEIDASGHKCAEPVYENESVATCTEAGGYDAVAYCFVCNEELNREHIEFPALGHDWDTGSVTTPPTATQDGKMTFTCSRCGETRTEYIPATGEKDPCDGGDNCPSKYFRDVKENDWYHEAVDFAVENGLFNGMTDTTFEPDSPMTRAMLVTVLWRYEGAPEEGKNNFTDVPAGQWYTQAVAWAAHKGIVGGVGGGRFDPNGNITREQMAAILFRYANGKGFDTAARGDLSKFPDTSKVSSWAKDAIAWAVADGIIGGSDGKLLPQGNATRAQVATILMRFIEGIAKK